MNAALRADYLAYLRAYGVEPPAVPENRTALMEATAEENIRVAERAGEHVWAAQLREAWNQNKERQFAETRHPLEASIDQAAASIAESISRLPRYNKPRVADVYCGVFPTGAVNAKVVKVEHGFIVLMNAGTLMMLEQICALLGSANTRLPASGNAEMIAGIVDVLSAYLVYGDSFFGPKPVPERATSMLLASRLTRACTKFTLAHEYAHVVAGHFEPRYVQTESVPTKVGPIDILVESRQRELEADLIGHHIILGVEGYSELDLSVIDRASEDKEGRAEDFFAAVDLKCAIAAPIIFLTIVRLLEDVSALLPNSQTSEFVVATHPSARDRVAKLVGAVDPLGKRYNGYIYLLKPLVEVLDETAARIADSVSRLTD